MRADHDKCVALQVSPAQLLVIALTFFFFSSGVTEEKPKTPRPGQSLFTPKETVEYVTGTLPVIIAAPHGGRLTPANIPDRTEGVVVTDADSDLLAREIAEALLRLTRQHAHLVICHLKRSKVDCNRDALTGTGGNAAAMETWQAFHDCIESARTTGRELYLDIHGHSHPQPLVELGYQLSAEQLKQRGAPLAALEDRSTISGLGTTSHDEFEERLRGSSSLGGLLESKGFPSVPSPTNPDPTGQPYFSGGFNAERYSANSEGEQFVAVQIECPREGVRDSNRNRKRFADAIADSIVVFLKRHAGMDLLTQQSRP
ncbi:MAG: hypothetical protein ABL994_18945 [Verrucomicrobiales bacterium]